MVLENNQVELIEEKSIFCDGGYDSDPLALWETENSKKF
jgi:hypothetical protein